MVFETQSYRELLKSALTEKAKTNPGYSLRAFSEKLGFSNSFLSEVLNGKKSLSVSAALKVAIKLDLTELESQYFCLLVQLEHEKDPAFREELSKRLESMNPLRRSFDLSVDLFKTISDWYHFAILELTQLPNFRLDAGFISKQLGISKIEAELAVERLKRLELVEMNKNGRYVKTHDHVLAQSHVSEQALKLHHQQILKKAIDQLSSDPKYRVSASDMIAFDTKYLSKVEQLSVEFSSEVMKLSEKSTIKDSVYSLSVHFFPVSKMKGVDP